MRAAQESFAERGYTTTTIRGVAAVAGVDPALILQFYGNKDGLFDAALRVDPPTRSLLALVFEGETGTLGKRLLRRYLELWETPDTGARLLAVARGASASPSASAMVAAFMSEEVMLPLARAIGADHAELRANLTGAHLLGLATARYVLRVQPLASLDRERLVAVQGAVVQRHLTGDLG
ncbi:Transcriptional regulator, TetR family [[Actinomadura] parvosata subsp. kistnae]|uniref:TetR/AcrR family transcriptional regulator n=1 Tax=[Actinomadura] parvosata TaxID=1955412 RepID=UPI000D2D5510|nr:Transcriptional regulator, TetR family [Actinomadura parvosata subsp. kistnae]